jgi:phenylacetyl-CoA:acceptor oxidoreductase subunit 2
MSFGPNPWHQQSWDARAAANFMAGGAGSGLIVFTALAGAPRWAFVAGAALVALGLSSVALEIGRPLRALNVYRNPRTSWMSREAIVALLLFGCVAAAWFGLPLAAGAAALAALAFVYCQGRMLQAAKGIPAWREPRLVPLILVTGLAEGGGLCLLAGALGATLQRPVLAWGLFALALLARWVAWKGWRQRLRSAPPALSQIDRAGAFVIAATLLPLAAALSVALAPLTPALSAWLAAGAGLLAFAGGQWFKLTLVTRAGFNQGFAIPHLPVRGVRRT